MDAGGWREIALRPWSGDPGEGRVRALPEIRKHYADNGLVPVGNTPDEFGDFLRKDIVRQAGVAKRIGLQAQ